MSSYTQLPPDWQSVLENFDNCSYHLDLVLDPEGRATVINGIINLSRINNVRELDPRWAGRTTVCDVQVNINDPDGRLCPKGPGSPFHDAVCELDANCASGSTELFVIHRNGVSFAPGESVTVLGEDLLFGNVVAEDCVVAFVTPGTDIDTIILTTPVSGYYAAGSLVYGTFPENREVQIRLHLEGTTNPLVLYRGRIQGITTVAGSVRLVLADIHKHNLDKQLVGVDRAVENRLMCINALGEAESSIEWSDDAIGGLDKDCVYPLQDCRPGKWQLDFITDSEFTLTGPGIKGRRGDIRYGLHSRLDHADLGFAWHLCKYLAFVYVPVAENGKLVIINAADPVNPLFMSAISFAPNAVYASAAVNTNYVFLPYVAFDSTFTGYLKCFHVANKYNPVLIDTKTAGLEGVPADFDCLACKVYGCYLFVQGYSDIFVFNISDPSDIQYVTRIGGNGPPYYMCGLFDFDIHDHYLYTVSGIDKRLIVLNIANPQNPVLVATLALDKGGVNVAVTNGHAFVKSTDGVLITIDVSDPANPFVVNTTGSVGAPWYTGGMGLNSSGNTLYSVSNIHNALTIMDVSEAPEIKLREVLQGEGAPFNLGMSYDLVIDGEYAWIAAQGGVTVYRLHPTLPALQGCEQLCITPDAWSGHVHAGDRVSFKTARTWENENPVRILHQLLTEHAGISGHLVSASGFFGRASIGTLANDLAPGESGASIAITAPVRAKAGETLVIDGHEFPVTVGNSVQHSYPPVISLSIVNACSVTLSAGSRVYRKAATVPDPDFNFDREYQWCEEQGLSVSLSLERDMSIYQAIECVTAHFNGFTFTDNWGVEHIFAFHAVDGPAISVSGSTNLLPNPELMSRELVNRIDLRYQYLYAGNSYGSEQSYTGPLLNNYSALRHGLERRVTVSLPGFYNGSAPVQIAKAMYRLWSNGLSVLTCRMEMQGIAIEIGDVLHVQSMCPDLDRYVRVTGKQFTFHDGLEVVLEGYDITGDWEETV